MLTFDPEHLHLVLTTHSTSHSTPLQSICVSIESTYITENHTTNMITLRTTDPAVPSGYLATYSVSQYICMENEINAALAAYELSRVKLQHSNSAVVVVATDHNDENDSIHRTFSFDTDAHSNASSPVFSTSAPLPYSLSPPAVPPRLSYDDEAEESGVFLTATTGATLSGADHTEQKDLADRHNDAENTDISIRQLRHYAEKGYASFLEMLHAQDPPVPEEPYVIIPSPLRPACFPSSVLSCDTGPVRPFLLPARPHTLHSHTVTSSQEHNNPGVDDNVAKESNNQNVSVAADTAPLVLPSRFGYLIKDALAAVKAAETERERLRLLELQRRSSVAPMELNTQSIIVPLSDHHKRNFRFYDPHSKHSVYELQNQLGANSSVWYTDSAISATSVPSMSKGYTASGYVVRGESVNITIEGTPLQNTQESSKSGPMSSKTARV